MGQIQALSKCNFQNCFIYDILCQKLHISCKYFVYNMNISNKKNKQLKKMPYVFQTPRFEMTCNEKKSVRSQRKKS